MQFRQQPGTDKRRFATAGNANYGKEAGLTQACEKLRGLFLASEEKVFFLNLERAKSGEGIEMRILWVHGVSVGGLGLDNKGGEDGGIEIARLEQHLGGVGLETAF
ncbi:uncharacterized protein METZ01_LOCUS256935, partial [marine metagenome]